VRFAFAFAPHLTRTGWARDGRPRAPRFVFLFFTSPPSFSFRFVFFLLFLFWRLSSVLLTILPLQAPPSFAPFHPHPSSRLFSPRLPRSLATNEASCPTLVRSRSPSFALLASDEEDPLVGFSLGFLGFVFLFLFFSCAHAFPTPFCINGDALSRKKKSKQ
jgi:hypothetical protein